MPTFIKDLLNSDISLVGVVFAFLLWFFFKHMYDKWNDIGMTKKQYANLETKIDQLIVDVSAEKESKEEMKKYFDELKRDFKIAFDDLHKVKNSMQTDKFTQDMNKEKLKSLEEALRRVSDTLIEMQVMNKMKNSLNTSVN